MKILLACSAGMSTSMLEKSMQDFAKEEGIELYVVAHSSETAKSMISDFDVVLLGPQVRFMLKSFKELAGDIPVGVIPPGDYALAKAANVIKYAKELISG